MLAGSDGWQGLMAGRVSDAAGCLAGYAVGSIPFGLWLGRTARGLDIRDVGSHNMGTANLWRYAGPAVGIAAFTLDAAKGAAAALIARRMGAGPLGQAAAAFSAEVGHSWPALAKFRGGKAVATGFGGYLVVSPEGAACALIAGPPALGASRMVSVGSLAAAATAAGASVATWQRTGEVAPLLFAAATTALVVIRHEGNIRRIVTGQEPTVGSGHGRRHAA